MNGSQDYEDKIAKLLIKAEAKGTTPEESEALTAAAERLMIKYGIEQAQIDAKRIASGGAPEQVVSQYVYFSGVYKDALLGLGHDVVRGLGNMKSAQRKDVYDRATGKKANRIVIVGFESDVRQAITLIESLKLQAVVAVNAWWRTYEGWAKLAGGMEAFKARRQFVFSFGDGVHERLRAARVATQGEAETAAPGTALVLRDRAETVARWVDENTSWGRGRASRLQGGDGAAASAGRIAGRNANTGGTSIGSRRAVSGR